MRPRDERGQRSDGGDQDEAGAGRVEENMMTVKASDADPVAGAGRAQRMTAGHYQVGYAVQDIEAAVSN